MNTNNAAKRYWHVFRFGDRVLDQISADQILTREQALVSAMSTTRVVVAHDPINEGWMGYLAKLEHATFIVSHDPFGSEPIDLGAEADRAVST